jgi:hypothetical protein
MAKTTKRLADENRASDSEHVEIDLGTLIKLNDAIRDIESMDDKQIGEGTWYECGE